jgi:hypothetical protein
MALIQVRIVKLLELAKHSPRPASDPESISVVDVQLWRKISCAR